MSFGMDLGMHADDLDRAAKHWQSEGWVVINDLVPADEIQQARRELPSALAPDSAATSPSQRQMATPEGGDQGGAAFRRDQFSGTVRFPIPNAPNLNRLFVHPRMIDFVGRAMQTSDLRIYQSRIWSKHAGRVNYEQPLHRDLNHSLVPTRSEPGWWHLECFLYLTDVDTDTGAPRVVSRSKVAKEPTPPRPQEPDSAAELYAAEVSAVGKAGSLFAYRSDVWHRGVDITKPGAERHVLVAAFKPGGLEWVGYDPHPPLSVNEDFAEFVAASSPEELALFGVPLPGHPYWTEAMIEAMAVQYPGLDLDPWRGLL